MSTKTLTVTECHQLLDALIIKEAAAATFRKGVRNYTIALLMLDAGLRVGEVVSLKIDDLWFNSEPVQSITISEHIAKNNEERIVPVSTRLIQALKEMDRYFWSIHLGNRERWAFVASVWTHPITTRQVERIINKAAMKSIGRPIHPHMLRHTFATKLMKKTSIRVVQQLLGHKNIGSTQVYTHPDQEDLKKAISNLDAGNGEGCSALDSYA